MFVDHLKIFARAGDGGDGVVHWIREKFKPKGGPDGGDGGRGGHVILEVDPHTDSLRHLFYHPRQIAENGQPGSRQRKKGRNGRDLIVKVPAGTVVRHANHPVPQAAPAVAESTADPDVFEPADSRAAPAVDPPTDDLVTDLVQPGQQFVLCRGGRGGLGNEHFKSSTNRAPQEATPGERGREGHFLLELRQIADAGVVGFPNAGKSSLIAALSAARPKIAAYPFTTLKPLVGVIEYPGFLRATVADIPGLVEGAHENRGLGHEFLRHIMRCRLLLFTIDMAGSEGREPWDDLAALRREVSLYSEDLAGRAWLVVANKMDLDGAAANLKVFRQRFPKIEIIESSAVSKPGVETLKARLAELVAHRPE